MIKMSTLLDDYRSFIVNWWVKLLVGILLFVVGIVVLINPADSYAALTMVFGLTILLSGIAQLYIAVNTPKGNGWGWLLATGIIEIILGVDLTFNVVMSAFVLPYFLGFWMLFRGLSLVGVVSDMKHAGIAGTGWTMFSAILLMVMAVVVLIFPAAGAGAIVLWLGMSFIFGGIAMIVFSYRLRELKKFLNI